MASDKTITETPDQPRRPGRQRSAAADQAILAAALDVLVEDGYGDFSINKVINRAGVSSATLYRRWATGDELLAAALRSMQPEPIVIDTGSLDGDLGAFIDYLAQALQRFEQVVLAEAGGPRAPQSLRDEAAEMFAKPRIAMLSDMLQRALHRGEITCMPSLTLSWTYVVSPVYHWLYLQGKAPTPEFREQTRAMLSAGLRAIAGINTD